jgi:uncharacterized protein YndB with AHSA1/START domain
MIDPDRQIDEQTLRIAARPETVWRYWTEPDRMTAWWGQSAELDPSVATTRTGAASSPISHRHRPTPEP